MAAATDLHDLQWLLSMPVSRAMLTAAGAICMRHLLRIHGPQLCASRWGEATSEREARELAELVRRFERGLVALEDIARLQADGVALPDREAWARGRAEAARAALAAGLELPDTRAFHGAQEDVHGFPFYPAPPVLLTSRKRWPRGGEGGGAPLGAA
ncbi:hypothetical protein [Falsiroseomonas sp.]|uniref:hypothetical protein n=1 Tax=Falsiroseomonas sp. TaxID=2870721 RepID=UPI003F706AA1